MKTKPAAPRACNFKYRHIRKGDVGVKQWESRSEGPVCEQRQQRYHTALGTLRGGIGVISEQPLQKSRTACVVSD